ncbi:DUF4931 domain-containing protein [Candidatus Woesearchaeota archaeon]|nr:DUF4931 domain-containing protein [Candidatus Woesearchaeota archaeon]
MELRKDYILDRWVILSSSRGSRPREFKAEKLVQAGKIDYFAPGHEELTPPEIGRLGGKKWKMRWFANKFPAVDKHGEAEIKTDNKYFTFASAYGEHEIIVETPSKTKQLTDLTVKEIKELFKVYAQRINEIKKDDKIKYICVFKNHGAKGGTSLIHSHSQIISYNKVPEVIKAEVEACKKYGSCPYCEIIQIERNSFRRCFENDDFVAFCPYASRFNYEIWIFPRKHLLNITELTAEQFNSLAEIMKKSLLKLKKLGCSYNYFLHYSPQGENLHFHIEICPRIATWGGFELSSETVINSVTPEDAASFYRE